MWSYVQTGDLIGPDGLHHQAYSGKGEYKNQPSAQHIQNFGPIPCGAYRIGDHVDTVTHGPFVLPLTPDSANVMFGRAGFLIHGDSVVAPGTASEGCIIVDRVTRGKIAASGDRELQVLASNPQPTVAVNPGIEAE